MRDAVAVAEKAAPYIHPRLSAVAATVRQVASVKDLSDAELAAVIRSLGGEVWRKTRRRCACRPAGAA